MMRLDVSNIPVSVYSRLIDGVNRHLPSFHRYLELRKRMSEQQKLEDSKTDVGWGHQIRSYVLDQSRIKDLRTNVETGNTKNVLDGDLDEFISASLKQGI